MNRRGLLLNGIPAAHAALGLMRLTTHPLASQSSVAKEARIPVIDVTDLYHPYEDPGDNVDLVHAFALPEIDLRAVILDVTENFRKPVADHPLLWKDPNGPREPGLVPLAQLCSIFDRPIDAAVSPYLQMRSLDDDLRWAPRYQQAGIDLLLRALRESPTPVHLLGFGSCRAIAAAYNREPVLLRSKVRRVHVCAGTASTHYETGSSPEHNAIPGGEWNVALDLHAFRRVLTSGLPVALYPCATVDGAFAYGAHNTYWNMPDRSFVRSVDPRLRNYLLYAFGRLNRADFLRCLDGVLDEQTVGDHLTEVHHVWETAVWLNVAERSVVQREGRWQIVPHYEVRAGDRTLRNELQPCKLQVREDGRIAFKVVAQSTGTWIFTRDDPKAYEEAMRQAWPDLWNSIRTLAPA